MCLLVKNCTITDSIKAAKT